METRAVLLKADKVCIIGTDRVRFCLLNDVVGLAEL
jgi:hypothetical protein